CSLLLCCGLITRRKSRLSGSRAVRLSICRGLCLGGWSRLVLGLLSLRRGGGRGFLWRRRVRFRRRRRLSDHAVCLLHEMSGARNELVRSPHPSFERLILR